MGVSILLVGRGVRSAAVWQCRQFRPRNYDPRTEGHQLVTAGIANVLRHPAYFGWFYWSIGTQILLCNPCALSPTPTCPGTSSPAHPLRRRTTLALLQGKIQPTRTSIIGIPLIKSGGGALEPRSPFGLKETLLVHNVIFHILLTNHVFVFTPVCPMRIAYSFVHVSKGPFRNLTYWHN